MEPTKLVFEEALEIVRCEVKLGRTFPTQGLDAECTAAPVLGWKHGPKAKHTEASTCDTEDWNFHHHVGDDEF